MAEMERIGSMTPEDTSRIVDAIDRNTKAVQGVKSELGNIGIMLGIIWLGICVVGCPRAKATPLLPPLTYEIGTPPLPPPNPHVQYWHTSYVPGPDGVLPVEVFAPRLVAQVASDAEVVDVPEPGTLDMIISFVIGIPIGWVTYSWLRKRKQSCQCICGVIVPDLAFFLKACVARLSLSNVRHVGDGRK